MAKNKKEKVKAVEIADKAPKKKKAKAGEGAIEKPKRFSATKSVSVEVLTITKSDIALRAYYIAEHRTRHSLPGDEAADWVEAERQLRQESLKKK